MSSGILEPAVRHDAVRVEELTGRNPRRVADLVDLLVAMALDQPM